ncbi:MAG: AtpZ/AtpI family protein [Lachnospiraceae bacterium]|nr:AtpZ/AtpI family protein [Lachnospiraceae bacterium]
MKDRDKKEIRQLAKMLSLITQIGISMMTPIFLCIFVGYKIDEHFNTSFTIIFLILGFLAGIRNCYILLKKAGL